MARQWRIEYKKALYHVYALGNSNHNIISDNDDYALFTETLGQMASRFNVNIFAFVITKNGYDLLLRTNEPNLSKCMQWFSGAYTRRFNSKNKRRGHLFRGRFRCVLVEDKSWLAELSCLIHRKPIKENISTRLSSYQFSSYPAYAYESLKPKWLNTKFILSTLPDKDKKTAYRLKVQRFLKHENRIQSEIRHGLLLGSNAFVEKIKAYYLPKTPHSEIPQQRKLLKDVDLSDILHVLADHLNCHMDTFKNAGRITKKDKDNRDLLLFVIRETGLFSNQEIGTEFGLAPSSVSRRVSIFQARINEDTDYMMKCSRLKKKLKL